MAIFKKESLELLKQRIHLLDVIEPYVELKPSGAVYKGLCPFHDEKTPSFTVHRADGHYHCFGCGAHGDAIEFLMSHQKMSFAEAVENLAARYQIHLETVEKEDKGPNKKWLHEANFQAAAFFHFILLNTEEGKEALGYLARRHIDLEFIKRFMIGWAPKRAGMLSTVLKEKEFDENILIECGLLRRVNHRIFDFFSDRITFPIHNASGFVVGFSARKIHDETYGGKYVNTAETPLFKKSQLLFGLNYSRRRIAKEKQVIIVEGQLDALRLIDRGMDYVVASQGTAFGEGHADLLQSLGVQSVYLAFDSDTAGLSAAEKVGDIFQKKGIEVFVVPIPIGADPDSYIQKKGIEAFKKLMERRVDYLTFLVKMAEKTRDMQSPAIKQLFVQQVTKQIRSWDNTVMVHESLRKLSRLLDLPQEMIGMAQEMRPSPYIRRSGNAGLLDLDPDLILESDCLRWMVKLKEEQRYLVDEIRLNLNLDHFKNPAAKEVFLACLDLYDSQKTFSRLDLHLHLPSEEAAQLMHSIDFKWMNYEQAEEGVRHTIYKILERDWMREREAIFEKISSGLHNHEEMMELMKKLAQIKNDKPVVKKS